MDVLTPVKGENIVMVLGKGPRFVCSKYTQWHQTSLLLCYHSWRNWFLVLMAEYACMYNMSHNVRNSIVECLEFDHSVKRRLVVMQVLNSFDSLLKTVKFPSLFCCCCCSYCSGKFIIICWNIGQKFISEQFTY